MKYKVHNRIFIEAIFCFVNLIPYYNHMTALLRGLSDESQADREKLRIEYQKKNREFDDRVWQNLQKIYDQLYLKFLNYSFLVSACSIFEYQLKRICALIQEEHKMPFGWEMSLSKASMLMKVKSYLKLAGIILKDDSPRIELPPPNFVPTEVFDENRIVVKSLWKALDNYFMVRNCIVHDNGQINEARSPDKVRDYAIEKGIILDASGQSELLITDNFNREVCNTMEQFFSKLHSAYYSTPLPE